MQEGRAPQRAAIGERGGPFGGVEDQLNFAIFYGVDNMRAALGDFVDPLVGNALAGEKSLGSRGREHPEAQRRHEPDRLEDAGLVGILDRDENRPAFWEPRPAPELT